MTSKVAGCNTLLARYTVHRVIAYFQARRVVRDPIWDDGNERPHAAKQH